MIYRVSTDANTNHIETETEAHAHAPSHKHVQSKSSSQWRHLVCASQFNRIILFIYLNCKWNAIASLNWFRLATVNPMMIHFRFANIRSDSFASLLFFFRWFGGGRRVVHDMCASIDIIHKSLHFSKLNEYRALSTMTMLMSHHFVIGLICWSAFSLFFRWLFANSNRIYPMTIDKQRIDTSRKVKMDPKIHHKENRPRLWFVFRQLSTKTLLPITWFDLQFDQPLLMIIDCDGALHLQLKLES